MGTTNNNMIFDKVTLLGLLALSSSLIQADNAGSIRHSSSRGLLVSCGGHDSPSCADCGDNASYCNGECEWITDECIVIGKAVSCGGHDASSCAKCGDNASYCNGECEWTADECKPKN